VTVVALGVPSVSRPVGPAPTDGPLLDTYGRIATDLRVSLTDRCNLRCTYCMPAEGLDWMSSDQLLTVDELTRLLGIAVTRLGVTRVRFTGGEPLLAKRLEEVIAATAALHPRPEITLTTNGIGLHRRAEGLKRAGLDRINVSLDTVDAEHFAHITRRDRLADVLAGLAAAHRVGLRPVKVNAVLDPTTGLADAVSLLRFSLEHDYRLRIIEQMPLDAGHKWSRGATIGADEVLTTLRKHFTLTPDPAPRGSAPAQLWLVDGGPATVGVIASVTRAFCGSCDRTRLTADGQVRNCLFAREESDLRTPMRDGATDAELADRWRIATLGKLPGHGIDDPSFLQPSRPMSAIGG